MYQSVVEYECVHNISTLKYCLLNVRKNQSGNQEWTIQRHQQHWVHKTQDELNRQNKIQNTTQKAKKMSSTDPPK